MGAGLTGDIQSLRLGLADEGHGLLCRDVAHVVGAAGLSDQAQVPGHRPPLTFGADPPVTMAPGVDAVVNVPSPQQAVVFAVRRHHLAQALGLQHACRIIDSDCTPRPSSEKATTWGAKPARSAKTSPCSPTVRAP